MRVSADLMNLTAAPPQKPKATQEPKGESFKDKLGTAISEKTEVDKSQKQDPAIKGEEKAEENPEGGKEQQDEAKAQGVLLAQQAMVAAINIPVEPVATVNVPVEQVLQPVTGEKPVLPQQNPDNTNVLQEVGQQVVEKQGESTAPKADVAAGDGRFKLKEFKADVVKQVQKPTQEVASEIKAVESHQGSEQKADSTVKENGAEKVFNEVKTEKTDENPKVEQFSLIEQREKLDMDKVNVKVSDVVDTTKGGFDEKLSEKILAKLNMEQNQFEIQLAPRDLGKINIKMVFEQGKAVVTMVAENAKTQNLLEASAGSIRNIVEAGTNLSTVVDVKANEDNTTQQDGARENPNKHREQENRKESHDEGESFVSKLRLGLIPMTANN